MKNKLPLIAIILYSVILLKLIIFKYPPGIIFSFDNSNLIPFKTILWYLSGKPTWNIALRNLLGNIVVLIPFGFIFAAQYQTLKWGRVLLLGLTVGVILEFLQVLFKSGIFDIDDIVLNSLGVILGYLLFTFWNCYKQKL